MLRKNQKQVFTRFIIMATIVALALTLSISAGGQEGEAKIFGKTYSQWSLEWFQWVAAIPADENPLFSDGEVDLSIGQDGKVWYLAGSWVGPVVREGTVPAGKAICFPIFNVWAYNDPDLGENYTEEELREMVNGAIDAVSVLSCTVDGKALKTPATATKPKAILRLQSPAFSYDCEVFGMTELAVMDGYWVMIPSLSEGEHVIQMEGGIPEWDWMQEITYNITVVDDDNDD